MRRKHPSRCSATKCYIVTKYLGTNLKLPVTSDFEIGKYIMAWKHWKFWIQLHQKKDGFSVSIYLDMTSKKIWPMNRKSFLFFQDQIYVVYCKYQLIVLNICVNFSRNHKLRENWAKSCTVGETSKVPGFFLWNWIISYKSFRHKILLIRLGVQWFTSIKT